MKEWQINTRRMEINLTKEINCQSNPGGQKELIPWHVLSLRIKVYLYKIKHLISETYPPLLFSLLSKMHDWNLLNSHCLLPLAHSISSHNTHSLLHAVPSA